MHFVDKFKGFFLVSVNPLILMRDRDRIWDKQRMRIKKNTDKGILSIQYQIIQTHIIRIVWQTLRKITNEILGVIGLTIKYS